MPSVEQCRANAAAYKKLGADPNNSARRASVLKGISRSWTALANQLENLAIIEKSEGDEVASGGRAVRTRSAGRD